MTQPGFLVFDLAACCDMKSFSGSAMRFNLWHWFSFSVPATQRAGDLGSFLWREHHAHKLAFKSGILLNAGHVNHRFLGSFNQLPADLWMLELPASKNNGKSNFVPLGQKLAHMFDLDIQIMRANAGPSTNFLELPALLLLSGFLQFLFAFVAKLGEINQLANRRIVQRGNFNQIEPAILGQSKRFFDGFDAKLGSVNVNKTNISGSNLVVNTCFRRLSYVWVPPKSCFKNEAK